MMNKEKEEQRVHNLQFNLTLSIYIKRSLLFMNLYASLCLFSKSLLMKADVKNCFTEYQITEY